MEGAELGDLECGSVQVENNLARSAGSSYRFGSLSWEGYRLAPSARRRGVLTPEFGVSSSGAPAGEAHLRVSPAGEGECILRFSFY